MCAGIKRNKYIYHIFGTLHGKHLFRTPQKTTNDILNKSIYKIQEIITLRRSPGSLLSYFVAGIFSFSCGVFVSFVFVRCIVLNVDRISELSILDWHAGFLTFIYITEIIS